MQTTTRSQIQPDPSKQHPESRLRIGLLDFDTRSIVRELGRDIRDDWFKDPLEHRDSLSPERLEMLVTEAISVAAGHPAPSQRELRVVPKTRGAVRYSLETPFVDRAIYHALATRLTRVLDSRLAPSVFSHRLDPSDRAGRSRLLKEPIQMWQAYRHFIGDGAEHLWILETDLQNCYEGIRLSAIEDSLRIGISESTESADAKAELTYALDLLMKYMPSWMYSEGTGLPQNRDASSMLANQVLHGVDKSMLRAGWDYARYLDDIRIRCRSRADALRAAVHLSNELRKLGMQLNAAKTDIHEPGTDRHLAATTAVNPVLESIARMGRSRNPDVVGRSLKYLVELGLELVDKGDYTSREFRFVAGRLSRAARTEGLALSGETWQELRSSYVSAITKEPSATDTFCELLSSTGLRVAESRYIEKLLVDDETYLYEYQRWALALLLLRTRGVSDRLLALAIQAVRGESEFIPQPLAFLALGMSGSLESRQVIREHIAGATDPLTQRMAIISAQEMSYKGDLDRVLPEGWILPPNKGLHQHLYKRASGPVYIVEPTPLSLPDFMGGDQPYV